MPWPVFARAMDTLMAMRGPDLLRVKGFLNVEGCAGPVVVQFVQHLAHAAGRACALAGRQPPKPRGVHHQGDCGAAGARPVRGGARLQDVVPAKAGTQ